MSIAGPNGTGTGGNDTGVGTIAWSNTGDITVDDSSYATVSINDGGCFIPGTLIAKPFGLFENIENLQVGDVVLSHENTPVTITETRTHKLMCWTKLIANNIEVGTTGNHEFLATSGFKQVEDLLVGDQVIMFDGTKAEITVNELIYEEITVHDLTVSDPHTYISNGFCVHNK